MLFLPEANMGDRYLQRVRHMDQVWDALATCTERGIHVYDDATSTMTWQSYADLVNGAGRLASVLLQHGIQKGERVLLCAETTPNFPVLWLALIWVGATPVPMPPRYALTGQYTFRERIGSLLRHFRFYCCHPDEEADIQGIAAEQTLDIRTLSLPALYAETNKQTAPVPPRAVLDASDHAFIQFTSGSTKTPKGILITWANLFANTAAMWERVEVDPLMHRWISWLPLYHDMGLVGMFLASVIAQNNLILISPACFARRPLQFLETAHRYDAHYCSMPNFAYEWILKRMQGSRIPDLSLTQFRWMGTGAEPVSPRTMAAFIERMQPFGLKPGVVSPCYGLAEATLAATLAPPGEGFMLSSDGNQTHVTCGEPVSGMEFNLKDGRIRMRGESVATHALIDGQIECIADPDGFYDTRDRGYFHEGRLVVQGRADEMFVINGENYFPYDIECAARGVEGVLKRRAVCFQLPARDGARGETVLLFERLSESTEQDAMIEEAIRAQVLCHAGLNLDIVRGVAPRAIPVTPSGKLQRLRARTLYLTGHFEHEAIPSVCTEEAG
ncbi:AMP-binding protein [Burkholderiaceae bacterium DAT-1]|nr:AMP-binding protein [Burkholderiaceae bacterium DAT-1]